jgi:hypothetical protein
MQQPHGDARVIATSGAYSEERLYILKTLERVDEKTDEQIERAAASKTIVDKTVEDLNRLGRNVRTMITANDGFSDRLTRTEIRASYIAAGAGAIVAIVIELGKFLLGHK